MRNGIVLEPQDVRELLTGKPLTFNLNGHEFDVWAVGLDKPGKRLTTCIERVMGNGHADTSGEELEGGVVDRIESPTTVARTNGGAKPHGCTCGEAFNKRGHLTAHIRRTK